MSSDGGPREAHKQLDSRGISIVNRLPAEITSNGLSLQKRRLGDSHNGDMEKRVNNGELNLRPQPNTTQPAIGKLHAGQAVEVLSTPNPTWTEVRTQIEGVPVRGFVGNMYLRDPINAKVDALAELAGQEYRRMEFGTFKDSDAKPDDPGRNLACPRVKDYWTALQTTNACSVAWSAAFISFVVRQANLGMKFKFAGRHTEYLADSKKALQQGDATRAYWCHPLDASPVQIGDLVAAWRSGGDCPAGPFGYEDIGRDFCSHCDLIVAVRGATALGIGGNVSNTVKVSEFELDAGGKLQPIKNRIALMKRRF